MNPYTPESQFAPPSFYEQQPPRRSGGSWLMPLLLVGGGVIILGGVLCIGGAWYVMSNIDRWLVGLGRDAIVALVEESDLPPVEQTEVVEQVDRVVEAYKSRKIGQADLERIFTELETSPALALVSLHGVDDYFLLDSELPPDEQAACRRTFERVLRGVTEGKITEDDVYDCLPAEAIYEAAELEDAGEPVPPTSVADIREVFEGFEALADRAGIPHEPFRVDVSDQLKQVVDRVLAGHDVAAR